MNRWYLTQVCYQQANILLGNVRILSFPCHTMKLSVLLKGLRSILMPADLETAVSFFYLIPLTPKAVPSSRAGYQLVVKHSNTHSLILVFQLFPALTSILLSQITRNLKPIWITSRSRNDSGAWPQKKRQFSEYHPEQSRIDTAIPRLLPQSFDT